MNIKEINEIVRSAREEQALFSTLDIDDLLRCLEKEGHNYLENKSLKTIAEDVYRQLKNAVNEEDISPLCDKLVDYFYVDNIRELRKSHYVRYIKKGESKLHGGGIVIKISKKEGRLGEGGYEEGGHEESGNEEGDEIDENIYYIGLLIYGKRYINLRFEDYIFFQKLTSDEKIILLSFDCIENFSEEGGV